MRPRLRRTATAALALLAGAALASCAVPIAGAATPAPRDATTGLERFHDQQLGWGPCAPFAGDDAERTMFAAPGLECARLTVPLDYSAPEGRTAEVAVLRQRTTQPKIGSLVVNPGGPGGSGIALAAQIGPALHDGPFDVVGFDPRGVGASTPAIDCTSDAEWDALRAENSFDASPAGVARAEEQARDIAAQCVERSGGADVLANAGTRDVARDMDVLRAALGERKLTYLGYSYGTLIGSTYAELFPRNVRAMVLDGAVDPTQTGAESGLAQAAGFQQAFDTYAAACTRAADCPLGTDPARTTAAFQSLARPLIDTPAPVRGDTRTLSYSDAVIAVVASLYSPSEWPKLTAGLAQLKAGEGTLLMGLADGYFNRTPAGAYGNDMEALMVVNCVDGDRITDRAVLADLAEQGDAAAPFRAPGRDIPIALDTCANLPVQPAQPHVPQVQGLPPTLVVSTTGDPATPYRAGVDLAEALGSRLLTVDGAQHTAALQGIECVDMVVGNYLVNLTLPADDVRCTAPPT